MARKEAKGTLIIAGPGAGKTHNMVSKILEALPGLKPSRYIAVITYTNSATNNITNRLSKKITIPENLFIGTIHSFLNRFIVIPFSSFNAVPIGLEKLFMQCGLEDIFNHVEKGLPKEKQAKTPKAKSVKLKRIKDKLNSKGYITFDQTLSIASETIENNKVCDIVSNRIQHLFVDEFQDTNNSVFNIIEAIRKKGRTKVYCVGDPEQYIQSFDSTIKKFSNIPILKAASSKAYDIEINDANFRCSRRITEFLNQFNGRTFGGRQFFQRPLVKASAVAKEELGSDIYYLPSVENTVRPMIEIFHTLCEKTAIALNDRCVVAKKNDVIKRIIAASDNRYKDPKKGKSTSPIQAIQDTLLTTLRKSQAEFFKENGANINTLRKYAIAVAKAINNGTITDDNSYFNFVQQNLKLVIQKGLPIKIENLKFDINRNVETNAITISNIHTIKGLEAEAVLAIAKTEEELLLWLETNNTIRDGKRNNETTDYPRLGYVAFSRAEKLLCISCLEKISANTESLLEKLGVLLYADPEKR